eukprot:4041787-Pleurochrysis_carterae.AAC.2
MSCGSISVAGPRVSALSWVCTEASTYARFANARWANEGMPYLLNLPLPTPPLLFLVLAEHEHVPVVLILEPDSLGNVISNEVLRMRCQFELPLHGLRCAEIAFASVHAEACIGCAAVSSKEIRPPPDLGVPR